MFRKLMGISIFMAVTVVSGAVFGAGKRPDFTPREVRGVVNINTATVKELDLLPGIGRHAAGLIVAYRGKQQFKTPHEIVNVKGVGEATFSKIRDHVTVSGPTTITATNHKSVSAAAGPASGERKDDALQLFETP